MLIFTTRFKARSQVSTPPNPQIGGPPAYAVLVRKNVPEKNLRKTNQDFDMELKWIQLQKPLSRNYDMLLKQVGTVSKLTPVSDLLRNGDDMSPSHFWSPGTEPPSFLPGKKRTVSTFGKTWPFCNKAEQPSRGRDTGACVLNGVPLGLYNPQTFIIRTLLFPSEQSKFIRKKLKMLQNANESPRTFTWNWNLGYGKSEDGSKI